MAESARGVITKRLPQHVGIIPDRPDLLSVVQ
jgi:hypothetical protein